MTGREAAIRAKLRSVNVETLPPDDLEYASDLDWLLAELAAAREEINAGKAWRELYEQALGREQALRDALLTICETARAALDATEEQG